MLTFVGQFMHTARSAVIIVVMYFFAGNRDVTGIVQILTYTYLAELFCLGSPICLFITRYAWLAPCIKEAYSAHN